MDRYLIHPIERDLKRKMAFIGGPRQVGKTTLALSILDGDETHSAYLNRDYFEDQRDILQRRLPSNRSLIVLDELHRYKIWRDLEKGLYDKRKTREGDVSKHIRYFASKTEIPFFFQVHRGVRDYEVQECRTRVMPFTKFAAEILSV